MKWLESKNRKFIKSFIKFYLMEMTDKQEIIKLLYQSDRWKTSYDAYTIMDEVLKDIKSEVKLKLKSSIDRNASFGAIKKQVEDYVLYYMIDIPDIEVYIGLIKYPSLTSNQAYYSVDRLKFNRENTNSYINLLKKDGRDINFVIKMLKYHDVWIGNESFEVYAYSYY